MLDDATTQDLSNTGVKDLSDMFKKVQTLFCHPPYFSQQEQTLISNMMNTVMPQPAEHQAEITTILSQHLSKLSDQYTPV